MKIGDLIYDSHFEENGLVVSVSKCGDWYSVLYEDGELVGGLRKWEETIEVINGND
jgi:hypothetical protein